MLRIVCLHTIALKVELEILLTKNSDANIEITERDLKTVKHYFHH